MLRIRTWVLFAVLFVVALGTQAQSNSSRALITQRVDESKLTVLTGNTHPLARAEFDRGMAPSDLPMERMLLVLKRSPEQEASLEKLLAEQQDKTSPNFHKWLTPEQFGQEFGPSDSDIETITEWLETRGFQVTNVAKGRDVIEFSGTAGQVQAAFHTEIHKYVVNGEQHWANSSDPQIPTALATAVAGIATLHDFVKKPQSHTFGVVNRTSNFDTARPEFTFQAGGPCSAVPNATSGDNCYALGPYDFATIYNVLPLWSAIPPIDGIGERIGVVGRSDIAVSDVQDFRAFLGLPAKDPNIIVNGPDPGTCGPGQNNCGDEGESDLDVEWSGAVARNATVDFVTSKTTATTDGVDLSAQYIVDNNLDPILSYSYGLCEADMGPSDLSFHNSLWQQAAAEGITVSVATGDTGASLCDTGNGPARLGLAVNGVAATPYDVAVGGTDFDQFDTQTNYWSPQTGNDSTTQESALGYIPETAYNDTCSNSVFGAVGFNSNAEGNCNNQALSTFLPSFGGGGGESTVYPKPSWQIGPGVPPDGMRDLPDISMFAGDGTIEASFYIVCQADAGGSCVVSNQSVGFLAVGGTSASTQVFGSVMALVDQKANGRQGLPNQALYDTAASQTLSTCNSSTLGKQTTGCAIYDVNRGTIAMPCANGSPDCSISSPSDSVGILSGCDSSTGYDMAAGVGSPNVGNLVNNWGLATGPTDPDFWLSLVNCTGTVSIGASGQSGSFQATISEVNGFAGGTYTFTCSGLPSFSSCSFSTTEVDATHTNLTVTVGTGLSSGLAPPSKQPGVFGSWPGSATEIALAIVFCLIAFSIGRHGVQNRRAPVAALLAFTIMLGASACGGGGNGGGGGGGGTNTTPAGTYPATLTVTNGSVSHSLNFTVSVR